MTPLERLEAIYEIEQNLFKYARGVDRRDWNLVRLSYHADANDNHGSFSGGVDGLINWMKERHQSIQYSIHLISNVSIEFLNDDSALVESYFTAYQRVERKVTPTASIDNQSIGRYLDHVTKRNGFWKVKSRDVVFDFYFSSPSEDSSLLPVGAIRSLRDNRDSRYVLERKLKT